VATKKYTLDFGSRVTYRPIQDGRRRHFGNSSECYKTGNYHPILMKIAKQTKKNLLSSKFVISEGQAKFQDGGRRHF
jgi:hypothetical protein